MNFSVNSASLTAADEAYPAACLYSCYQSYSTMSLPLAARPPVLHIGEFLRSQGSIGHYLAVEDLACSSPHPPLSILTTNVQGQRHGYKHEFDNHQIIFNFQIFSQRYPPSNFSYGSRAFAVSGPTCWNFLPSSLKSPSLKPAYFCKQLKTAFMALSSYSRGD